MSSLPWREAWQAALYGPDGFYRAEPGPVGHFTTSTHGPLGTVFAEGIAALADREGATHVVDVGAGRGELLTALHRARPDLDLTGVDVVERPTALPGSVRWLVSPGGPDLPADLVDLDGVLVVAHEWLDVVPCTIVEVLDDGTPRTVSVDAVARTESLVGELSAEDTAWCAAHWPMDGMPLGGHRVEVGLARDRAWSDLVSRVRRGTLLAVDYGHTRDTRPPSGTLVGYRDGAAVPALPDGTCDLTAHVAVDSLEQDERWTQRQALHRLLGRPGAPDHALATTDPATYVAGLARASALRALTAPGGLGDFHWVVRRCGRLTG